MLEQVLLELRQLNATLAKLVPTPPSPPDLASGRAFRWLGQDKPCPLSPIDPIKTIRLEDLKGIDRQKAALIANTRQFLKGLPANNALLWGARGTGKSSLIQALLNAYGDEGLRIIEVARQDLQELADIQTLLKDRPEKFILYCDDLSFEADDANYKALKAILEGSMAQPPSNLLIYATSNRRHLLPEYLEENHQARWVDGELHQGEAVEEKLSLSERFGVWLAFHTFDQQQYLDVVEYWLERLGFQKDRESARTEALAYALLRGSRSGRVASQFAKDWAGKRQLDPS
jgi:hypothetical protein